MLVGTKAQFIKMAPVLREMDRTSLPYWLVYTGQHSETFDALERAMGTRAPDEVLVPSIEASTKGIFLKWTLRYWLAIIKRIRAWRGARAGLVHGDTASTLFGALALRLAGVPVVHVEAGLRSPDLLDPFPEEITRRAVSRLTSLHFAPDATAATNLQAVGGAVVNTHGNTLRDALRHALDSVPVSAAAPQERAPYAVVSMHRNENLSNVETLRSLLEEIVLASGSIRMVFVLHPATRDRLKALGMTEYLRSQPGIELVERMDYPDFVQLLLGCRMLLTDGGSNQEEAAMLGIPTLLLRRNTERADGVDSGMVVMSRLEPDAIRRFVQQHVNSRWQPLSPSLDSPARLLVAAMSSHFPRSTMGQRDGA